jgi:hypothetical protein
MSQLREISAPSAFGARTSKTPHTAATTNANTTAETSYKRLILEIYRTPPTLQYFQTFQ